jgi:hypothetical protein
VNLSPLTRVIKEIDRGEKEFKAFDKMTFSRNISDKSLTILSILILRIFRVSRLFKSLIFFKSK